MSRLSDSPRWMLLLAMLAVPARADDAVYPPGSRIGLVPFAGLHASTSFLGFEDADNKVAVLVSALPAEAYAAFEKSNTSDSLKKLGAVLDKRETLTLPSGKAVLVVSHQDKQHIWLLVAATPGLTAMLTMRVPDAARDVYSERAIRTLFATVAVRAEVPVDEQLGLLPFRLADMAGFRVAAVLPGRGVVLTDGDPAGGSVPTPTPPHIVISVVPGEAVEASNRDDVARQIFRTIPGLSEVRITGSEPIRIGGQQGHEIMASAKDPASGAGLSLVQWLRFGGGAYLHIVAIAPTPGWPQAYGRFRTVRDAIR
jgi:hypothetical protein